MPRYMIRPAGLQDAESLSQLGRLTFSETFAHLYPPEDLASFLDTAYAPEQIRALLTNPDCAQWLLDCDSDGPVGYALAGRCSLPHQDVTPRCGELKRIYIRKTHQGGGRGRQLLATALDWLERDGPRPLWIGVWSGNHGAQRLYAAQGFETVGAYQFRVGNTLDDELIFRRLPRLTSSEEDISHAPDLH